MTTIDMSGIRRTIRRTPEADGSTSIEVKTRLVFDMVDMMMERPGNFLIANSEEGDWIASASFDDDDEKFVGSGDTAFEAMTRLLSEMG